MPRKISRSSGFIRSTARSNLRKRLRSARDMRGTSILLVAVRGPFGHHDPALLQQVAAPVGRFGLVGDHVRRPTVLQLPKPKSLRLPLCCTRQTQLLVPPGLS